MSTKAVAEPKAATPAPKSFTPARSLVVQRKCACGGSAGSGGECSECRDEKLKIQRNASNHSAIGNVPPVVHTVLNSAGRPLDTDARSFMENRFGQDFSGVRIHNDAQAGESARAVNAHAYTVGQDVVFAAGKYQPESHGGRELLAHELAHTVQQRGLGLHRFSDDLRFSSSEDARLEREADAAARAVIAGGASPPSPTRASAPRMSRAPAGSSPVTEDQKEALEKAGFREMDTPPAGVTGIRRFLVVEAFPLPGTKGPAAKQVWDDRAQGGGLESIIDVTGDPLSVLKQVRPPTETLKSYWLTKIGWSETEAGPNWKTAGGDEASINPPAAGKKTCEMDHTIELQVGGTNVKENIQALDKSQNASSGSTIRGYLSRKARELRSVVPELKLKEIVLHWDKVAYYGAVESDNPCIKVELNAVKNTKKKAGESSEGAKATRYPVSAGGLASEILITEEFADKKKPVPIRDSSLAENKSAATLIPGLSLLNLHLNKTPHTIDGEIDTNDKTRLPGMTLKKEAKGAAVPFTVDKTGKLSQTSKSVNIDFTYRYLSAGKVTHLALGAQGLEFSGWVQPSLPLFGKLDIQYKEGKLAIIKGLDEATLKKQSLLGMHITKAQVQLQLAPEFKPEGEVNMQIGAGEKPVAKAALKLSADSVGLIADGKLNVNIPKMQTAEVDISYRGGGDRNEWKTEIHIKSEDIKLGSQVSVSGQFDGLIQKGDLSFVGKLNATFPPDNTAELGLSRNPKEGWVLSGSGKFMFPKLDQTTVKVVYYLEKDKLVATGATGFKIETIGLRGRLDEVTFTLAKGEPLKVHGKGGLDFKKGKAEGHADVTLRPDGKFTGKGSLSYKIKENIIVTGTVELNEQEKLRVTGELLVTRYEIFKQYGDKKDLFTLDLPVPVPGLSIGTSGLVFHISGGVGVAYSFGPGTLEPLRFSAGFDPLESDPDLELTVTGSVKVPASATLSAWISGSLAVQVDILVGSAGVEGGLKLQGDLILSAGAFANFDAAYKKKRLTAKLEAGIDTKLLLGLSLTAFARAWAGAFGITGEVRKDWTLAKKTIDTQIGFYLSAPFEYADETGVKLPELKDITLRKPNITTENLKRILGELFGGASEKKIER
jgi:hypothetical protein